MVPPAALWSVDGHHRYLLVRPVGRTRLLVAKLVAVAVAVFVLLAVIAVAVVSYVVGVSLFASNGGGIPTLSGTQQLDSTQATLRTIGAMLYVGWSMLGVASIAVFFSTVTESPLVATLGAIAVLISSGVLQALDAAWSIQPYLPTRYWLSFVDLFRQPILWRDIDRGIALQAVYVSVMLLAAWANFTTRDVATYPASRAGRRDGLRGNAELRRDDGLDVRVARQVAVADVEPRTDRLDVDHSGAGEHGAGRRGDRLVVLGVDRRERHPSGWVLSAASRALSGSSCAQASTHAPGTRLPAVAARFVSWSGAPRVTNRRTREKPCCCWT